MIYDTIIIGGGPAGLTAGLYLKRAMRSALVIESQGLGGQIATAGVVENFPSIKAISGIQFADDLVSQALDLGVEIEIDKAVKIKCNGKMKIVVTEDNEFQAKTVIIATGVKSRKLNINESQFEGRGVSYCAVCDGAFYKDKIVAVVGGGNSAVEEAIYLSKVCNKVYLVHRRKEFRAEKTLFDALNRIESIELCLEYNPKRILGKNKVSGMILENAITKAEMQIDIDGVFVAIGKIPQNDFIQNFIQTQDGYINSTNTFTDVDGVFVAGDCRTKKFRQLTTAVGDGTESALNCLEYLRDNF